MSCPFKREREEDEEEIPPSPSSGFQILGFQAANPTHLLAQAPVQTSAGELPTPTHYGTYLGIEQLLRLQDGPAAVKEGGTGLVHHEELTFIIVHQVFELWFKLVTGDLIKVRHQLIDVAQGKVVGNTAIANLITQCVSYLRRSEAILHHAQGAFGIMETMHPADFIEFRDYLVPASGFQSVAFRSLEQLLGVPNATRALVNAQTVFSYLLPGEQKQLADEASLPSLHDVVTEILCRVNIPEGFLQAYLETNRKVLEEQQYVIAKTPRDDPKAKALIESGVQRMESMLNDPAAWSEGVVFSGDEDAAKYKKAVLAALFVISYRFENHFSGLATLLDSLIAVEEGMLLWRGRHIHMAERMIGRRSGTGGTSSGVGYLDVTRRYRIFHGLWLVRKLFIRASALPTLASYGMKSDDMFAGAAAAAGGATTTTA